MTDTLGPQNPKPPDGQQPAPTPAANIHIRGATLAPQIMGQILAGFAAGQAPPPAGGLQLTLPGIVQQSHSWQGPYPPPDAVERYDAVLPGAFNRMITMAENLQSAQIAQSDQALRDNTEAMKRGQLLGAGTTVLAMVGAIVCVVLGAYWVAGAFLSVPVMAVGKALIDSARSTSPEINVSPVSNPPQQTPAP